MTGLPQTRSWQGIEAPYPPCLRHDYPALLDMAEAMLATRTARFPRMVQAGKLAADEAERQLAIFGAIAADWRWICHGVGEPAAHGSIDDRRDALDASIATIAALARQHGGFSLELQQQAHCVISLRWHLEPGVELTTRAAARLTHEMRAAAPAARPAKEPALAQ